jgi:ATP-binding cassette subfamily F protein 3
MLSLSELGKAYGGRTLFADLTLQVNRGDRIGIVGANGSGKSTLFSIILGTEPTDTGRIEWQRGVTLGHLPQESAPAGDETVLDLATSVSPELVEARRRLRQLERTPVLTPDESAELHDLHARVEELGVGTLEARAQPILDGLAFRPSDFGRPARELSGGWVMRAHLARLLVQEPDLLLLDEPTNHLDLEALLWFQEHLETYRGALLLISHDRDFLNRLATEIVEIRHSRAVRYRGNYDAYLEQREANEEQWLAAYKNQQREIARLERFIERFHAKNTKASQARSKQKQIDRMDKIEAPDAGEATVEFAFPQPERGGLKAVALERVDFSYGARPVYRELDFVAERAQRIVLVGPNGAGKSTLLKLLAGVLIPQAGERRLGHNVKAGYYAQYRVETLHPDFTVLDEAFDTPQRLTETFVRSVLGSFLFRGDDVFKKVSVLSGGEKSRLALVRLLLDPPNLLLMDEPTTHLDLASVDALLYALDQFSGTLVFISHDVYFIRSIANHVVHVQDGVLTYYPGDYQYYLDKTAAARAAQAAATLERFPTAIAQPPKPADLRKAARRLRAEQRQARSRARRAAAEEVTRLETRIAETEHRQTALTAQLQDPATYADSRLAVQINRDMQQVVDDLARLTAEWETAATRLHELDAEDAAADLQEPVEGREVDG